MSGRCCVFQPFDKGPYDKRYDDILVPSIRAAGLDAYRVDRDDGAIIPIETLHDEIKSATVCLADIGSRNPNVMYELGFAIASGKEVVIICADNQADRFPFDIQHRGIVRYASDSVSDFEKLKNDITARLKALTRKQQTTEAIAAASPVKTAKGLQPHEIACIAFVMANSGIGDGSGASMYSITTDMEKAGYTSIATKLALLRLIRLGLIESFQARDHNDDVFTAFGTTASGQDWLLENQDRFEIRLADDPAMQSEMKAVTDDDVPF